MKLDELFCVTTGRSASSMILTTQHQNRMGKSHGGNQAYLGVRAMETALDDPASLLHLSVSYLSAVPINSTMIARPQILHSGRRLVYTSAQILEGGKTAAIVSGVFGKKISLPARPEINRRTADPQMKEPYYLREDNAGYAETVRSILAMNDRKTMDLLGRQTKGDFLIALQTTSLHADQYGIISPGLFPILADISCGHAVATLKGISVTIKLSCTVAGVAYAGDTLFAHGYVCSVSGSILHTQGEIYTEKGLVASTDAIFYHP